MISALNKLVDGLTNICVHLCWPRRTPISWHNASRQWGSMSSSSMAIQPWVQQQADNSIRQTLHMLATPPLTVCNILIFSAPELSLLCLYCCLLLYHPCYFRIWQGSELWKGKKLGLYIFYFMWCNTYEAKKDMFQWYILSGFRPKNLICPQISWE